MEEGRERRDREGEEKERLGGGVKELREMGVEGKGGAINDVEQVEGNTEKKINAKKPRPSFCVPAERKEAQPDQSTPTK